MFGSRSEVVQLGVLLRIAVVLAVCGRVIMDAGGWGCFRRVGDGLGRDEPSVVSGDAARGWRLDCLAFLVSSFAG